MKTSAILLSALLMGACASSHRNTDSTPPAMTQYILLIHENTKTNPTAEEWNQFFSVAHQSGLFKGGSAIGDRIIIGDAQFVTPSNHIGGFMRFDSDDKQKIMDLLQKHPVVTHGGSVELCEMPKS